MNLKVMVKVDEGGPLLTLVLVTCVFLQNRRVVQGLGKVRKLQHPQLLHA